MGSSTQGLPFQSWLQPCLLQQGCGMGGPGAHTLVVSTWSSLLPAPWARARGRSELPRALSSVCSASKSFWCSEQAACCCHSSCLRDSAEGRAVKVRQAVKVKAEVCPGEGAAEGLGSSSPNLFQDNSNKSSMYSTLNVLKPLENCSLKPCNHPIQYHHNPFDDVEPEPQRG